MGQCVNKLNNKNKKSNKLSRNSISISDDAYKVIEINCDNFNNENKYDDDESLIKPTRNSSTEFKLLNQVKYDVLSVKSEYEIKNYNPFDEFNKTDNYNEENKVDDFDKLENDNNSLNIEKESKNNSSLKVSENEEDDEQNIVLINTGNNIVDELLHDNNNNFCQDLEKIEKLIAENNSNLNIKNLNENEIKKSECKYEKVFRDGYEDDLELLNKCLDVKKPILYCYKGNINNININRNEKLTSNIFNNNMKFFTDLKSNKKSFKNENKIKDSKLTFDETNVKNNNNSNVIETIEPLNLIKNNKKIQNEFGDFKEIKSSNNDLKFPTIVVHPVVGDMKKIIDIKQTKSKSKSKNYITAIFDPKKNDNTFQ